MAVNKYFHHPIPLGHTDLSQPVQLSSSVETPPQSFSKEGPAAVGGDRFDAHGAARHWLRLGHYLSLHSADGMELALQQVAKDPQRRGAPQAQAVAEAWRLRGQDPEGFINQHEQALETIAQRVQETGLLAPEIFEHQDFAWVAPRK